MQILENSDENPWDIHKNEIPRKKPGLGKPTPVDREIMIGEDKILLSITDARGVIEYCNEDFVEVSGYEEYELAGSPHNIVRHPDMPRVIFKMMWERIQNKQNIIAVVKNLSKTGRYYWVVTDFVVKEDKNGHIVGYKAFRKPAPRKAIETVIPLYKKLQELENVRGIEAAEKFLNGFFDSEDTTYDDFIENLIIDTIEPEVVSEGEIVREEIVREEIIRPVTKIERKSFFKRLFGN